MLTAVKHREMRTWVWEHMGGCTGVIANLEGRETHGGKTKLVGL